jgi:hypothetical protein
VLAGAGFPTRDLYGSLAAAADDIAPVAVDARLSEPETVVIDPAPHTESHISIVNETLTATLEPSPEGLPADEPAQINALSSNPEVQDQVINSDFVDECLVLEACVDRYLWRLYERTPKEDAVGVRKQIKVTIRKKGRMLTVTRTSTTVIDEDFAWKDPQAARRADMSLMDYVIGGVDRDFKLKLFQMLHAAEQAGLAPGITSGFRDDYRQSIAAGLKAANDRSYHGGSLRGGYGHGLAADIVSVKGGTRAERLNNSRALWNWVDDHGSDFGIGRPYLGRDPPHVAPADGEEYARHRPGMKVRHAAAVLNWLHRDRQIRVDENSIKAPLSAIRLMKPASRIYQCGLSPDFTDQSRRQFDLVHD